MVAPLNANCPVAISIKNCAKREDVGSGVQNFSTHLLGRHVRRCTLHHIRRCESEVRRTNSHIGRYRGLIDRLWIQFGQAKIQNFGVTALRNENIHRLNVAVDNPQLVRSIQTIGDLGAQVQDLRQREPATQSFNICPSKNSMAMKGPLFPSPLL